MSALAPAEARIMPMITAGGVRSLFSCGRVVNGEGIRKKVVLWRQASWLLTAGEDKLRKHATDRGRASEIPVNRACAGSGRIELCSRDIRWREWPPRPYTACPSGGERWARG